MHIELAKAAFWITLLPAFIGGFLGLFSALIVSHCNARFSAFSNSYGKVIEKIEKAADLSSEYWLLAFNSAVGPKSNQSTKEATAKGQLLEARILGYQEQILLLDSQLRIQLDPKIRRPVDHSLNNFLEALTGGDFMSRTGSADVKMARQCQKSAAQLIANIHRGVRQTSPLKLSILLS